MSDPLLSARVRTSGRKTWRLPTRRRRERAAVVARNVVLATTGTGIPQTLVERDPMLLHLVVEDLCWQAAVEDLRRHRPRRGDRAAAAAWRTEQARLEAERKRLAAMVAESISAL